MKPTAMSDRKKVHEGRNVKRFREMLNLKQDALAWELGEDWNQQKVSLLEQKEGIHPSKYIFLGNGVLSIFAA